MPDLTMLNTAEATAINTFRRATRTARETYRQALQAQVDAEVRWLADPEREDLEKTAGAAFDEAAAARVELLKVIKAQKAVRTKAVNAAWDEATRAK